MASMKIGGDYMRLIDAEPLRGQLKKRIEETESMLMCRSLETFMRLLDLTPTADVAPVRHGRWEDEFKEDAEAFVKHRYVCTVCGKWQTYGKTAYCPNCGARMDR